MTKRLHEMFITNEASGGNRYAVAVNTGGGSMGPGEENLFFAVEASSPEEAIEKAYPDVSQHGATASELDQVSNGVWADEDGVYGVYDLSSPDARKRLGELLVEELETVRSLKQGSYDGRH